MNPWTIGLTLFRESSASDAHEYFNTTDYIFFWVASLDLTEVAIAAADGLGMVDTPETSMECAKLFDASAVTRMRDLEAWFISEVLPLESALMQFLRNNWRNADDILDIRQDIYVRILEAASDRALEPVKPFVFTIARNIIIDRYRRERIVPIDGVPDLEAIDAPSPEPGPDRRAIARDELRRLQEALDELPKRCREALVLKQVEGLSRKEIAQRMGILESTVNRHLYDAVNALLDIQHRQPIETEKKL